MYNYSIPDFKEPLDTAGNGSEWPGSPSAGNIPCARKPTETCVRRHGAQARLIAQVARLYHEEHLTQNEIATKLRFSQGTVCRLLQKGIEEGIVQITVVPPEGTFVDLEELLEQKFGLAEVIIARAASDFEESVESALGAAAAHYLETTLKPRDCIGVDSWSATLRSVVEQMNLVWKVSDCQVVQVLGWVGHPSFEKHAHSLMTQLASLVQGEAYFLPAPCVVASKGAADVLAQDPHIRETMRLFEEITVALVGIGSVEPSSILASRGKFFSSEELQTLEAKGAVGSICLRFYNGYGEEIESPFKAQVFGLELAQLKSIPRIVGIAGGKRRREAILGALRGHWINVLITDQFSAEALLKA
jgi:DNA-binding transcriptional regulator LsrR (DeoR family)